MEDDKWLESLDQKEIIIEEITPGNQNDELESLTKIKRMIKSYLEFLDLDLDDLGIHPYGEDDGDYLLKLKIKVRPEALMTPEQKEVETKFQNLIKDF